MHLWGFNDTTKLRNARKDWLDADRWRDRREQEYKDHFEAHGLTAYIQQASRASRRVHPVGSAATQEIYSFVS